MTTKTTNTVLGNLKMTLEMAHYGLKDLTSKDPKYRELGLRNLAMHGRSVTFVLQNLKNLEPDFEDWYREIQTEMKSSDLCRFFLNLRNEIEKQGVVRERSISAQIDHFSTDMLHRLPRPDNVKITGFFMGDQLGGSGWEIELPDGTKDKFYLELPESMIKVSTHFTEIKGSHLGTPLEGKTVEELGSMYYKYLSEIVSKAIYKFKN